MKLTVEMPDRVWGLLVAAAAERQKKVADLVGDAIAEMVSIPPAVAGNRCGPPLTMLQQANVHYLWSLHWLADSIAEELGLGRNRVRQTVASFGGSQVRKTQKTKGSH